jgi:hypothetical protein
MNGEVQLIVRSEQVSTIPTLTDALTAPIVSGDSFCFGGPGQETFYTIGSKIEIIDQSVSPEIVLFTRYVTAYDTVTGEITVDQPFTSNVTDEGVSIYAYTLIVADSYLDLFENESISQNWKFQDLSNFTAQGAFSREFRIPMSDNNIKAIGPLFDTNSEQGAENYFFYKLPAEIRVDTLPIASGYLRVRKVYKQMNRINEVEVAFYAETPDLVRTIGEKKLSDIAALADLNEAITYANVTTETADRIWSLCDRAQKWSNDQSSGSRPIRDVNAPIYPADLTPAVSWWFLLRNIVKEAGFDLVASSLENILNDYWMPFCNTPQLWIDGDINQYFFRAYNATPFVFSTSSDPQVGSGPFVTYNLLTEVFDNNGDFTAGTGTYTVPGAGTYTFAGQFGFQTIAESNVIFSQRVNIAININGVRTVIFQPNVGTNLTFFSFTYSVYLASGDIVKFELQPVSRNFSTVSVGPQGAEGPGFWINIGTATIQIPTSSGELNSSYIALTNIVLDTGQIISYSLNAPNMRQIDFVNDVVKMHNCAIIPSRIVPNQIAIIPQNNYLGTGDVVDWTSKLDISKDVVISSTVDIQKATFQFTYTAGEDAYSKLYRDAGRVYGDFKAEGYTINPSTAPSDFAIGDQKISLVTRSAPAAMLPGSAAPIQCFYNDNIEFVAPGPRALFYAGIVEVNLYNDVTNSASPITLVPILNHYSDAYPNVKDFDLNWAPETPPHVQTVQANPYNNLFNLYWRNYMNEIYSPEGRIMEAFFALDLKDILTFSFADKIWIQDSYWRILEISDYKVGLQESTKVKLIKFLDQINDCSSTPVGITTNGEVQFESDGTPVESTEDCCSRYGYFWDESNGVCWAFNNGGQFRSSLVDQSTAMLNGQMSAAQSGNLSIENSVIQGGNVLIESPNSNLLAVGSNLRITKSNTNSNALGKNVETNLPGLHIGGGYRGGNPTAPYYGWAQFGTFVLQRLVTVLTSGSTQNLYIEGVAGEYINLPDETLWSCLWNVTIKDTTGASETSIHHFTLDKTSGIATASAITTLSTIGSIGSNVFTFGIDTTTDTDEHRINITFTGGSYPDGFLITSSLQYQQSKTA